MLAIPKAMLDALNLSADASVALSIRSGRLVIDAKKRRRYSLDDCWRNANHRPGVRVQVGVGRRTERSVASSSDGAR